MTGDCAADFPPRCRPDLRRVPRRRGRTCIHYAASKGHADCIDVVSTYVQAQGGDQDVARLVNFSDFGGFSPLHCAVWCEQIDAVHSLCGWGSYLPARLDWEVLDAGACNPGSTSLHLAALRGNLDIAVALLHYQARALVALLPCVAAAWCECPPWMYVNAGG
jgi:ankyrin repeat protein